jgi:hypothetical protein
MRLFVKILKDQANPVWDKIERVLPSWEVNVLRREVKVKVAYFNQSLKPDDWRRDCLLTRLCGKTETGLFNEFFLAPRYNLALKEAAPEIERRLLQKENTLRREDTEALELLLKMRVDFASLPDFQD